MKNRNGSTRRDFLVRTSCAAMSAAALSASVRKLGLMSMFAQDAVATGSAPTSYKALVCLYLAGGNDSNNMLIPNDTTRYTQYFNIRNPAGLAIPQASLLPINSASAGAMGIHPAFGNPFPVAAPYPNLQALYNAGHAAFVTNVGSLVQPMTKVQYQTGSVPRPYQLFSHSDQTREQLTSNAYSAQQTGIGGRLADKLISLNNGSSFPMVTSIAGSSVFGIGLSTRPLGIGTGALNQVLVLNGFTTATDDVARKTAFDSLRSMDNAASLMINATSGVTQQALDIKAALVTDPTLTTQFPNSSLGNQLKQVAKVMKLNQTSAALSLNRQIFYVGIGGFDTHQNEISSHNQLYNQIGQALASFYQATIELGIPDKVTLFTLSDFGRTLGPSGSGAASVGTDHAWGSHHIVMGGAVNGGNLYGQNGGNGTIFPELVLGGIDDFAGRGRFGPTTSIDTYGATLGTWFGLAAADLPYVFPNLSHFPVQNLGFV